MYTNSWQSIHPFHSNPVNCGSAGEKEKINVENSLLIHLIYIVVDGLVEVAASTAKS